MPLKFLFLNGKTFPCKNVFTPHFISMETGLISEHMFIMKSAVV